MSKMFQSVGEIALEEENLQLKRELDAMRYKYEPCLVFLGMPTEEISMPSPHFDEIRLPKIASWTTKTNEFHVPCMIGTATDRDNKTAEISYYCSAELVSSNSAINILGELHMRALQQLASMYQLT